MGLPFESTSAEVRAAFEAAKNPNSAVKTFLKRESRVGDQSERFAKEFRAAVTSSRPEALSGFIDKHYPKSEMYFLALSRYAHGEVISATVEKVFDRYAEEFNTTYEKNGDGIRVVNSQKFREISQDVVKLVKSDLLASGLPPSNFLIKSTLVCIFEPDVFKEVLNVVSE